MNEDLATPIRIVDGRLGTIIISADDAPLVVAAAAKDGVLARLVTAVNERPALLNEIAQVQAALTRAAAERDALERAYTASTKERAALLDFLSDLATVAQDAEAWAGGREGLLKRALGLLKGGA